MCCLVWVILALVFCLCLFWWRLFAFAFDGFCVVWCSCALMCLFGFNSVVVCSSYMVYVCGVVGWLI